MTKQFSNYSDLLTFTRASKGHALRPVSYGDEIINNGDFELGDNGDWGVSTNWTISGGVATLVGGDGVYGNSGLYQVIDLDVGKIYKVSLDVSGLTGTFRVYHASYSTGTNIDSTGTLVFNIVGESGGTRLNILGNNGSAVTLDNISVKEVLFDQPDGTLTLFEHPDDVPRVEYDADGNRLGLLVEESRTNLFTESEELSLKDHNMDTTDNAVIAPDRTQTASFCKPDTSSSEHFIDDAGVTTGTNYAISCFAKQGPGDYLLAFRGSGLGGNPPRFNLATGTIDNEGASSVWSDVKIQEIGNGWYRCSAVGNPNQSTPLRFQITESDGNGSFAGDGTSGLYIWGCQIEQASFPTSYIKSNSGSTTTRSADVASIPVADFGYNQSEGTVVVEAKTFSNAEANHGDFALTDSGTSADLSSGSRTGSSVAGSYSTWYRTAGTTQANLVRTSAVEDNVFYKAGFCYKANDFAQSVDGGSILSDSSGTVPSRNSVVLIGDNYYGKLNGHIKSIKYFPRRLTNAQLVDLTS
jgi:hypothetical protein